MGWFGGGEALLPPAASGTAAVTAAAESTAVPGEKTVHSLVAGAKDTIIQQATAHGTALTIWICGVRDRFHSLPDGEQALIWALGASLLYSRLPELPPSEPEPEPEPELDPDPDPVSDRSRIWPGPYVALALVTTAHSANARWGFSGSVFAALRSTYTVSIGSFLVISPERVTEQQCKHAWCLLGMLG